MKTPEEIAQWVINNRYPKSEKEKVSDAEMYHSLVESIVKLCNLHSVSMPNGTGCEHPVKFVVWCEDDGMYWCNKCEQYVMQTAR